MHTVEDDSKTELQPISKALGSKPKIKRTQKLIDKIHADFNQSQEAWLRSKNEKIALLK